jgi:hypothetical protein
LRSSAGDCGHAVGDRSCPVRSHRQPVEDRSQRRRPPCRDFGGDARSKELALHIMRRSRQISALHREQLADIAEFDRAEGWRGDGAVSMVAWVTAQCGVSTATARQWVRSAANLESLPCLAEGLASGELSLDLVEPLAEVASPETDAALREASAHWSVRQARELVVWHRAQREEAERAGAANAANAANVANAANAPGMGAKAADGFDTGGSAAREFEHRTLHFNDTRRTIWVAFTKDDYARAKSSLVRWVSADKRDSERADARAAGSGRVTASSPAASDAVGYVPYDQRLYDALMHLFSVGSTGSSGAGSSGAGSSGAGSSGAGSSGAGRRTVRPRVVVHAPLELLVGCSVGGVAEIEGVGPVSAEVVRRLACDANVVLSVEDRDGSILDQGRARRDPTVAQRIEIARRDKGCRFPGCTFTEFTDVHHVHHWTKGGATNLDNLTSG